MSEDWHWVSALRVLSAVSCFGFQHHQVPVFVWGQRCFRQMLFAVLQEEGKEFCVETAEFQFNWAVLPLARFRLLLCFCCGVGLCRWA